MPADLTPVNAQKRLCTSLKSHIGGKLTLMQRQHNTAAHRHLAPEAPSSVTKHGRPEEEALCAALLEARDHERKRIAQEIHDTTAQDLIASKLYLEMALAGITDNPKSYDAGARALKLLEHSLHQIRTLSYLLHPPCLSELGMGATIRSYLKGFTERTGIQVASYVSAALPQLAPEIVGALFAILQEALTNVYRHSGRSAAAVTLYVVNDRLRLDISDYGARKRKPPVDSTHRGVPGVGVASMRARAAQHGGAFTIHSASQGTTVCVEFPVH